MSDPLTQLSELSPSKNLKKGFHHMHVCVYEIVDDPENGNLFREVSKKKFQEPLSESQAGLPIFVLSKQATRGPSQCRITLI